MNKIKLGFAFCGSFCTIGKSIELLELLTESYDVIPIMSFNAAALDTRFGRASDIINRVEGICDKKVIRTIEGAEPIGPKRMTDIMLISPCTGNTLAKLANSITDTPVTMAVKSHLRNDLPVVVAVSTNDALSGSAKNIGILQNFRNFYFVPMAQDNWAEKQNSLVADFSAVPEALSSALSGKQLEPLFLPAK